eukprot:2524444-Prymnesium_polylepis.1
MPPGSSFLPVLWGTPLVLFSGARYISGPIGLLFPRTGIVHLLALPPPIFSWRIRVLPASVSCLLAQCAVSSAGA